MFFHFLCLWIFVCVCVYIIHANKMFYFTLWSHVYVFVAVVVVVATLRMAVFWTCSDCAGGFIKWELQLNCKLFSAAFTLHSFFCALILVFAMRFMFFIHLCIRTCLLRVFFFTHLQASVALHIDIHMYNVPACFTCVNMFCIKFCTFCYPLACTYICMCVYTSSYLQF